MIRKPVGPTLIGALDPTVKLEPDMLDVAWRNEINVMSRQLTPILLQTLDPYQILDWAVFYVVQIGEQLRKADPPNQQGMDLLNYFTQAAYQYHQALEKTEAFQQHQAEPNSGLYIGWPPDMGTDELEVLKKLRENFLDIAPKGMQQ